MNSNHSTQAQRASELESESTRDGEVVELSFIELLTTLGSQKWIIIAVTVLFSLGGAAYSLLVTPQYQSTTTLMPSKANAGVGAGMASTLAALTGGNQLAQVAGLGGIGGGDEFYIALLRSQSVQDRIIERLDLKTRYGQKMQEWARDRLTQHADVGIDKKSSLLRISVSDPDPKFAAQLANIHVEELQRLLSQLAVNDAQQRRVFFERQIEKGQLRLAELDQRFRAMQELNGIQLSSVLGDTALRTAADLRAQIATREIQLQAMSRFAAPGNTDLQRLGSEVAAMRAEVRKLEEGGSNKQGRQNSLTPAQQEGMLLYRELKVQEAMLEGYVRQLAAAKYDEAREGPPIQVVDVAQEAEARSKPERRKLVVAFTFIGLALGLIAGFARAYWQWMMKDQASCQQLKALQDAWRPFW
jgi:tyrosine-protein kinase Etk/Wzc